MHVLSIAFKVSSGKVYNPKLKLNDKPIPYLRDTMFWFLSAPVSIHSISDPQSGEHLTTKPTSMLEKVDATSITCQQKLQLFKLSI